MPEGVLVATETKNSMGYAAKMFILYLTARYTFAATKNWHKVQMIFAKEKEKTLLKSSMYLKL